MCQPLTNVDSLTMGDPTCKILTIDDQQLYANPNDVVTGDIDNDNQLALPIFSNSSLDAELCSKLNFSSWASTYKPEDIDGGLATDFDGSLQGLGVEVAENAFDMRYIISIDSKYLSKIMK